MTVGETENSCHNICMYLIVAYNTILLNNETILFERADKRDIALPESSKQRAKAQSLYFLIFNFSLGMAYRQVVVEDHTHTDIL